MPSVTVQSPAKINLCLAVGPVRADGFHPLATVYQAVSLFDHVSAVPAADGQVSLELDTASPLPADDLTGVPADGRNLAVRAARLLAERTGSTAGVHLRLRKAIPRAAGLAGGSTDAAAALVACDALWQTRLTTAELQGLAAELGSDVPFCLLGGTATGSGRGELVSPLPAHGEYHWVLAVDKHGLATPAVYAELDRLRARRAGDVPDGREEPHGGASPTGPAVPEELTAALRAGDPAALGRAMSNDLQPAALSLRPDLSQVLGLASSLGASGCLVSGSGPTCLFLAADRAQAEQVCRGLGAAGLHAVHQVTGPVPGARVVSR